MIYNIFEPVPLRPAERDGILTLWVYECQNDEWRMPDNSGRHWPITSQSRIRFLYRGERAPSVTGHIMSAGISHDLLGLGSMLQFKICLFLIYHLNWPYPLVFNQKRIFKITYIVDISAAGLLQNQVKTVRVQWLHENIHRNRLSPPVGFFQILIYFVTVNVNNEDIYILTVTGYITNRKKRQAAKKTITVDFFM